MTRSKAYAPKKMRAHNKPTQCMEPHPDPTLRGKRKVAALLRVGVGSPSYAIAAEFNRQCRKESAAKREEFARRAHAAQFTGDPRKAEYWRKRAMAVCT